MPSSREERSFLEEHERKRINWPICIVLALIVGAVGWYLWSQSQAPASSPPAPHAAVVPAPPTPPPAGNSAHPATPAAASPSHPAAPAHRGRR